MVSFYYISTRGSRRGFGLLDEVSDSLGTDRRAELGLVILHSSVVTIRML